MKRYLVLAVMALLALPVMTMAWTIELDLAQTGTGATAISVAPGTAISVDVRLTSNYQYTAAPPPNPKGLDGIQYQIESDSKVTDGLWNFPTDGTAMTLGTVFASSELTSQIATYAPYGAPYNNLAVINSYGAEVGFKGQGTWVLASNNALVATYAMIAPSAPGVYVLSGIKNDYGWGNNPAPVASTGGYTGGDSLTVTVTPEPATALLLIGAIPFLRRRRA